MSHLFMDTFFKLPVVENFAYPHWDGNTYEIRGEALKVYSVASGAGGGMSAYCTAGPTVR